jgi:hypothetical protein
VLTFDYPERRSDSIDAIEVEVPGISAQQLRDGFQADAEARERLVGGSVTLDGRPILIASLADFQLVERFVGDRQRLPQGDDPRRPAGVRGMTIGATGFEPAKPPGPKPGALPG